MAIETIRDLAFKISMSVELSKLKEADKAVDAFKSKVIGLQKDVSQQMSIINKKFNNFSTQKAIQKINDMTKATDKLRETMGGVVGTPLEQTKQTRTTRQSRKRKPEPQFTLPHLGRLASWSKKTTLVSSLAMAGYYSMLLKVRNVGLQINTNSEKNEKLIQKQREATKGLVSSLKNVRDFVGKTNFAIIGGVKGLSKMVSLSLIMAGIMKGISWGQQAYNKSLEAYADMTDGLVRQEAFYANALKYREKIMGEALNTGANSYEEYRQVAQKSLAETRKNIALVAKEGVVGAKSLTIMTGQLASFQIDTDAWFAGEQGARHINALADLMASIQSKTGSRDEALRTANMIGKAVTMGHFGQLQRWGIVLSDEQKELIKTGTTAERLSAIMQGLEQNVGNFNKEISKTPQGKLMQVQNKIGTQYYKLGKYMIFLRIQMLKLYNAWLPTISIIVRMVGSIIGVVAKLLEKIGNLFSFVLAPTEELTAGMKLLRHAILGVGGALLIAFAPFWAIVGGILLLIEDFWTYLNGGESVIGDVIEWFRDLWEKIVNVFESIKEKVISVWDIIKSKFWEFIDWVKKWYKIIKEGFFEFVINVQSKILSIFLDIGNKIKEFFNDKFQWITSKIDWIKEQFKKIQKLNPFADDDPSLPQATPNDITNNNPNALTQQLANILIQNGAIQIDMSNSNTDLTEEQISKAIEDGFNKALIKASIQEGVVF